MKPPPKRITWRITWRVGQDDRLHAIVDCDPHASGWVAVCSAFVTGPEQRRVPCRQCRHKLKEEQ